MKKRLILGSFILLFLIAIGIIANYFYPFRVGHITSFSYWSGHYWSGYSTCALVIEDGTAWAVESFEPTDGMWTTLPKEPWERRRELSEEELRAFELLVIRELRIPAWPAHTTYTPEPTDQSSWAVTFVYNGKEYEKTGYAKFPDGLQEIYSSLSVPPPQQ